MKQLHSLLYVIILIFSLSLSNSMLTPTSFNEKVIEQFDYSSSIFI